jgi:hypothetical protein
MVGKFEISRRLPVLPCHCVSNPPLMLPLRLSEVTCCLETGVSHASQTNPKSTNVPASSVHLIMFCAITSHRNATNRISLRAPAVADDRDHQPSRVSVPTRSVDAVHLILENHQTRSDTQHPVQPVSRCASALSLDPFKPLLASR